MPQQAQGAPADTRCHCRPKLQLQAPSATADTADLAVEGKLCSPPSDSESEPEAFFERQVRRPIPPHLTGELRTLAESLQASIFSASPDVRWDAVAGLDDAKKLLQEAVVFPVRYPQFFQGAPSPQLQSSLSADAPCSQLSRLLRSKRMPSPCGAPCLHR